MSQCRHCIEVDELSHNILSFLHISDLFACKVVSKSWNPIAVRCLLELAKHPDYSCFTYLLFDNVHDQSEEHRRSTKSLKTQRQLARIQNRQKQKRGGLLLFGGAFGTDHTKPAYIHDFHPGLYGNVYHNIGQFFPGDKQGAVASFFDHNEQEIMVLGGWDEERETSLSRVMKLSVSSLPPLTPSVFDMTSSSDESDFEDSDSDFEQPHPENLHVNSSSASSSTSTAGHRWLRHSKLPETVCYGAATMTLTGDIMHIGGGNSPFRGARVFDHSYLYSRSQERWLSGVIGNMNEVRCGHSAVTLLDGKVLAVGGYGGELLYYDTAELYDFEQQHWYPIAPMKYKRSGMAAVVGPGGSIYVAGGSENGEIGQRVLERYDPREGKWTCLAAMQCPRGYLTGSLTASMHIYVNGGLHNYRFQGGMERYDIRKNVWETLIGSSHCLLEEPSLMNFVDFPAETIPTTGELPIHGFSDRQLIRAGHQLHYIF